jgi:uncharacterized Zn-finger protein
MKLPMGDELQSFEVFGKDLATSDLLQNYDRKDTCDKPYQCDVCGKRCSHNSDLKRHIRTL